MSIDKDTFFIILFLLTGISLGVLVTYASLKKVLLLISTQKENQKELARKVKNTLSTMVVIYICFISHNIYAQEDPTRAPIVHEDFFEIEITPNEQTPLQELQEIHQHIQGLEMGPLSPHFYFECLPDIENINDIERLRRLNVPDYYISAWQAIRSGSIGKHPLDLLIWNENNIDLGYWHINHRAGESILGTEYHFPENSVINQQALDIALALLYWDRAEGNYYLQYSEWYRGIRNTMRTARREGCRSDNCMTVTASIANSSRRTAIDAGRNANWTDLNLMLNYYSHGNENLIHSNHRERRASWLRQNIL
tara:strand:+ start:3408 stop:4337 length:930 start_codon:yes stop_codon:yes gene_type:complete